MTSATKVGEIFTKAGDSYNKIGDMLVMLHPAAQELVTVEDKQQQQQIILSPQQTISIAQPQQQQVIRTIATTGVAATPTYVSVGGQAAQVVNGVVTIPQGQIQTLDGNFIKTEVVNTPLAVQQIQQPDVSALLEAAVSQTEAGTFITSDPPVVANEEEIAHIVNSG